MPNIKLMNPPEQDNQTEVASASRHRDETQRHIDERFGHLVAAWHKNGKPAPDKAPADRITVGKADVASLKAMIRRAATLHKHTPVFFRDAANGDGNTTVKYTVAAPPPAEKTEAK